MQQNQLFIGNLAFATTKEELESAFSNYGKVEEVRIPIDRNTGARGLRSIMEDTLLDTMFDLPTLEGVEEIVVNGEVVDSDTRPLLIYAERREEADQSA